MKEKHMMYIGVVSLLIAVFILMVCIGITGNYGNDEIENDIISDSQYNFQVMRDIFTPMYNDSVTVESAGWDNGFCFWVNHTQVLNSYYFPDANCYLMRFNHSTDRWEYEESLKVRGQGK